MPASNSMDSVHRISNGISLARIITMFWIFSTNYFAWIFPNYYGIDIEQAASNARLFSEIQAANPWPVDRVLFWFAAAEWPPVTIFAFLSGFSLWFSILNSGSFRLGDYAVNRFNSIYVPFFISSLVAFFAGGVLRGLEVERMDLGALLMGATLFVPSAARYNGAVWFMSLIFLSYLFFPIIPVLYNRLRVWGLAALTLASFAYFAYFGSTYFMRSWGALYPLMPFWLFLCLGVLACHLIFTHRNSALRLGHTSLGIFKILSFPAVFAGFYLIYRFLYLEPSANLDSNWFAGNAFWAGLAGAFCFFAIGYLLPAKLGRPLRWLSNGTFTVFLYHFIVLPFAAPYITPAIFTTHISIALVSSYCITLIYSSALQHLLNATVLRFTRTLSARAFEVKLRGESPAAPASPGLVGQPSSSPRRVS